jgi:hypothetical protein
MPSEEPGRARRPDSALNLIDSALHDGAVILDAYGRFATTLIGVALFPYVILPQPQKAPRQSDPPKRPQSKRHGMVNVVLALLIGAVLGRRLFAWRRGKRKSRSDSPL